MTLFKALIIFIMVNTLLYGTRDVWPKGRYDEVKKGLGPKPMVLE